jgi:hemerythrin-like metal-binding protein
MRLPFPNQRIAREQSSSFIQRPRRYPVTECFIRSGVRGQDMTIYTPNNWDTLVKTRVPVMDHHHQRLLDIFNEADYGLHSGVESAVFRKIVNDLLAYSIYHFDAEETLMRMHGYSALHANEMTTHIHEHRVFVGKVVAFRDDHSSGAAVDRQRVLDFLRSWIVEHIARVDPLVARFILQRADKA